MRFSTMIRTGWAVLTQARPIVLFHKPTARCDCRCRFCDSWVNQPEASDVLPTATILSLLDEARAAGMTGYTVWGGEPLLAPDLPQWLSHASRLGMQTVLCTSGTRLAERAAEIGPYLDRLLLSLEAVGERQDQVRGAPGLFARILAGLPEFQKNSRAQITLWSNLTRENQDQVEEIARFAAERKILVEFFPAAEYPGFNERLILSAEERDAIFNRIIDLKRRGYPILNTRYALELMQSGRSFQCNIARLSVQVMSDGQVFACEPRVIPGLKPYGRIGEIKLDRLAASPGYQETCRALDSCNRCLLPCVANVADSLLMQSFRKALNLVAYHPALAGRKLR